MLAAIMLCGASGFAYAQLIEQYFPGDIPGYSPDLTASVLNRMAIEGQSQGAEFGDVVIRPQLDETVGYNSDTLGRANSGSVEINTDASLNANSDWTSNAVNASFSVNNARYPDEPAADDTSWTAGAGGSLDLGEDVATIAYLHQSLNLGATSVGALGVETPVPFSVDDAKASYLKLFGRLSLTMNGEFENYGFGNGGAGDRQNYSSLTHHVELARATGRFEEAPGDALLLIVQPSVAQFAHASASNYTDISGFGGIDVRGDRIIQYRVLVGVEHRQFSHGATPAVTTPTFELNITWTPTQLDTITATGTHRLDDPVSPFARDQDLLDGRVEIDHELRTNVFLTGYAGASRSVSPSTTAGAGSLSQTELNAGFSGVWNFSRHCSGTVAYGFTTTETPTGTTAAIAAAGNARGFSTNAITIGLQLYD